MKQLLSVLLFTSVFYLYAQTATVVQVTGKAEIQNGQDWVSLKAGDSVKKGDVISIGFKSELLLKVNTSNIKLGPLTRLTFEQLLSTDNKNQTAIFIDSGKVNAQINATQTKREDFKVSSPVATASVRGTEFTFKADGNLFTASGLVSKGPATSSSAQVSTDTEASDYMPESGQSNAFTSTTDVSQSFGIPVFAGQTSTSDPVTGLSSSPQTAAAFAAKNIGSGTERLSSQEAVVTVASAQSEQSANEAKTYTAPKKGSIAVTVTF